MKRLLSGIVITLLLVSMLASAFTVGTSKLESTGANDKSQKSNPDAQTLSEPPPTEWNKTYGGIGVEVDQAWAMVQTADGGYALAGIFAPSSGGPYVQFLLIKTDTDGNLQWNRTYGETGFSAASAAYSLVQTSDGGYVLAGSSSPYYGIPADFWLVRTDANGNMQWNRTYGGTGDDFASSIVQTDDGGYAIAGSTDPSYTGWRDFWLVNVDADGNMRWNKTYGGVGDQQAFSLIQTIDGGYAIAGLTSYGGDATDCWLVKTDSNGNAQWNETYGGANVDIAYSVVQTGDGGYALAGETLSFGAGNGDCYLVKTDGLGNMQWNKTYGGTDYDYGCSIVQTFDGGYAVAGSTQSFGAGSYDFWLVKTDSAGNAQWNQTYGGTSGDLAYALVQTFDGGYALAGYTYSYGAGSGDCWLVKVAREQTSPRSPWGDDDGNGVLNYLDVEAFKMTHLVKDTKIPLTILGKEVGEIDWPVSIDVVEAGTSQTAMLNTMKTWGIPTADSYMCVLPLIFDIASVESLVTTLKDKLHLPSQMSGYINNQLCSDGHFRLLMFFGVKQLPPEFSNYASILKTFKNLLSGQGGSDLLGKILDLMDLSLFIIKDGVAPVFVKAVKILSVSDLVESLKTLVDLVKDEIDAILEVADALATGGAFPPIVILALAEKAFTFTVDYIVSYVPIPTLLEKAVNWVKGILETVDPPEARLDLQLYNSTSNELMLGYNSTGEVDYTCSDFGFLFEDPDKQIFILLKDVGTCNITIACSGSNGSVSLPYTFTLLDRAFNTTTITGSFLSPSELTSATLTINPDNTTTMGYLLPQIFFSDSHPRRGETVTAYITVKDDSGQIVSDSNATLLVGTSSIPLTSFGNGTFLATIDTSELDGATLVYVYAKQPDYMYGKNVDVLDVLVPNVSVDAIATSKNVICSGFTGDVNVTLNNHGNFTETFNITLYADSTTITTQTATIANGSSSTLTFTWNTTGFAKGNYTISAYAWPVLGETDTADNNFTGGWVEVTIVGDVNGDGKVDGKDMGWVAWCFGSYPRAPPPMIWNPNCDINNDGKVDGKDLGAVAWHFGEPHP